MYILINCVPFYYLVQAIILLCYSLCLFSVHLLSDGVNAMYVLRKQLGKGDLLYTDISRKKERNGRNYVVINKR